MNSNMEALKVGIVTMLCCLALGGTAAAAEPERGAGSTGADPQRLAHGAQAWAANCARCHNLRDPKELRDDQWRAVVAHMRVRANLTGREARDILAFLQGSN